MTNEHEAVTITEEEMERGHFIVLLNAAYRAKEERDAASSTYSGLIGTPEKPEILRRWARGHPDEVLYDGETGVELVRQMRSAGERLDVMGLVEHHPEAVLKLAELGLLQLIVPAWRTHPKDFLEAMQVKAFMMAAGETEMISVRKRDG